MTFQLVGQIYYYLRMWDNNKARPDHKSQPFCIMLVPSLSRFFLSLYFLFPLKRIKCPSLEHPTAGTCMFCMHVQLHQHASFLIHIRHTAQLVDIGCNFCTAFVEVLLHISFAVFPQNCCANLKQFRLVSIKCFEVNKLGCVVPSKVVV